MNKPFWILSTGVNSRHLHDVQIFDKRKDAIKALDSIASLSEAYRLTRHQEPDNYTPAIIKLELERIR